MTIPLSIIPSNEAERMSAVRRYEILDTPPDSALDRITALAARRFDAPISIISIVDTDRIWFKSHHGIPLNQVNRDPGLCASAILSPDPHVLEDARVDVLALANPLVAGDFGFRFYAGVPLRTDDGCNLGTLCVIDKEPRPIDRSQIDDLKDLAAVVMDRMELRASARQAVSNAEMMAREIDHRVMNSLQFISTMLEMQGRSPSLTDAASQLQLASERVAAVARVHRHFYLGQASESVSCLEYIRRLCADLSLVLGTSIDVHGDDGKISRLLVQPIGLLLNELVTNAAKHGKGRIIVTYRGDAGKRWLRVCDQGKGLPPDFNIETSHSGLGMKVVGMLAKQLRGTLIAGANPGGRGSCFEVSFAA